MFFIKTDTYFPRLNRYHACRVVLMRQACFGLLSLVGVDWWCEVARYCAGGGKIRCRDLHELHALTWLWRAADQMMAAAKAIYPLLNVAEHREAGRYYSIIHEYPITLQRAQRILAAKTSHVQLVTHGNRDWHRIIPHLRDSASPRW
ncbi:hypothetical protein CAK78_11435 [Aeromonas sp. A35_P]|uniref:P22AR C-terminal domain-containing protein n=1 Tax=Aeromonas sp. A35_P TaxID=1983805 RepID=UPI000B9BD759|nr:P22AR C-terminal domain-containing protein [Aeromonas sp. A35_P]OZG41788.1 hypothetical protein CAK78_11435 [Aeromonas sp. A35_P]